jgi:hypothetical protein
MHQGPFKLIQENPYKIQSIDAVLFFLFHALGFCMYVWMKYVFALWAKGSGWGLGNHLPVLYQIII